MRTFRFAVAGSIAVLLSTLSVASAAGVTFRSPDDAMKQGISAFNGGYYELALPAFEALAATKPVIARFYEARIYGDNEGAYTDHAKAYRLYSELANELKDIDPDDDEMAPIAAKSLTEVSMYLRNGITDAGIHRDVEAADRALQRAALTFNDEDAQFELAKVLLRGEGPEMAGLEDPASKIDNGRHWLSRLSRSGHPGAQAFLADLLWRGKFVRKDPAAALNLIDVAVSNAPPSERVWIEDIYQNIFCNAGEGVRKQATGRVAEWHSRYGRRPQPRDDKDGLEELAADPIRTCANGELVRPMTATKVVPPPQPLPPPAEPLASAATHHHRSITIGIGVGSSGFAPASGVGGPPAPNGFAPTATVPQGEAR
jgi:TPR repeat protein